jgi:hypothetical protein
MLHFAAEKINISDIFLIKRVARAGLSWGANSGSYGFNLFLERSTTTASHHSNISFFQLKISPFTFPLKYEAVCHFIAKHFVSLNMCTAV